MPEGVEIGSEAISGDQVSLESSPDMRSVSAQDPPGDVEESAESGRAQPFFDPGEASRIRWARHRERQTDETASAVHDRSGDVVIVRTTVDTGKIIERLAKDAKGGNTQSARELREWLKTVEIERDTDVSALDKTTRQKLKARLLHEIAMEGVESSTDVPALILGDEDHIESTETE